MRLIIRPLTPGDWSRFQAHCRRHWSESGRGDPHFLPFAPDDPDGPKGIDIKTLNRSTGERGWQRCWVAIAADGTIVGDVELKGSSLISELHRCELGIGIERSSRGGGLGRRLMETAIEFARDVDTLAWIDLRVFAHNAAGRALYRSVGFVEVGTLADRFRIDGESIDDVTMTLSVG